MSVCVPGQDDYDRLRPLSYQNASVVLICYDVTNPTSFDNVLSKVKAISLTPIESFVTKQSCITPLECYTKLIIITQSGMKCIVGYEQVFQSINAKSDSRL